MHDTIEWLMLNIAVPAMALLLFLALFSFPIVLVGALNEYKNFMNACIKEHAHYKCVALWRAGNNSTCSSGGL